MSNMVMVCDRFQFKNHIDAWCKQNCNPNTCAELQVTPKITCFDKILPKINYCKTFNIFISQTMWCYKFRPLLHARNMEYAWNTDLTQ